MARFFDPQMTQISQIFRGMALLGFFSHEGKKVTKVFGRRAFSRAEKLER
jgi:hypothetical protein